MYLLRYRKADGVIVEGWSASRPAALLQQVLQDDPWHDYVLTAIDVPLTVLQTDYCVWQGVVTLWGPAAAPPAADAPPPPTEDPH